MQYALNSDGVRIHIEDANKKETYLCPCCNSLVVLKQGNVNAWHYAHKSCTNCDELYLEDEWARKWMDSVNENCREIIVYNKKLDKKRKANMKAGNVVVLLQNKLMSSAEFQNRVDFFHDEGRHLVYLVDLRDKDIVYIGKTKKTLKYHWKHAWKFNCINKIEETFDLFFQIDDRYIVKVIWNYNYRFKYFGGYKYRVEDFKTYLNKKYQ